MIGTRMTYLALPVVRARHDGVAGEDDHSSSRPRSCRWRSSASRAGRSSSASGRGRRCSRPISRARRSSRRSRSCTPPGTSRSRCSSGSSRCSARFAPPYFASQRTILPGARRARTRRACRRRTARSREERRWPLSSGRLSPVLLIPFLGAANVLYVDAATYLVAFVLVLVFVPRRKSLAAVQPRCARGRALPRPRRAPRAASALTMIVFGLFGAGLSAGLPVYAYDEFDGSARIAGLFYAALGAGAIVGTRARGHRRPKGRTAPTGGVRDPRVLGAALGDAVPCRRGRSSSSRSSWRCSSRRS